MFKFIKSATKKENWYEHNNKEVAFWGRSNVGKSSLINAIVSNGKLARVSKTPGRTQLLNFFENEHNAVLVDLPGYGYAKMSETKRIEMMKMIEEYLLNRKNLESLYLLIDSRHGITGTDFPILEFLVENKIPFAIVFTKADKLKQKDKAQLAKKIKQYYQEFGEFDYFIVSSESKMNIHKLIEDLNEILGE
ncbi:YihA family ribosome biogenesis GTP-binding protein [Mycoplasma sp. Pen4]|uniref:ribosome biogenesis GTP-binding protein YihA/YsxC n=1 Tax=Mycoplasma sp. Pen4 TaxID=640330 RepID=UPI0016545E56|nr:ribosome biogenesis GTP-binding protein YihA/YsxC [Mycoplasma sp. Pen4]QNM93865.1 YihA family ribosome biogenesis GTP-binding protein [Mycoplasma sp. Pen4]